MTKYRTYEPDWKSHTKENIDALMQIAQLTSELIKEKDIAKIAKESLKTIADLTKMTELILTIWDEDSKRFRVIASFGYVPEIEKKILSLQYSGDWISLKIPKELMVIEDVLYLKAEDMREFKKGGIKDPLMLELFEDMEQDFYLDHPEEIDKERRSEDHWHELDFFEFIIRDYNGVPIGYIEINDTQDESERLPSKDVLLNISLITKVTGIALQTARMKILQEETTARIESLSLLMTQDIDRFLQNLHRTLSRIKQSKIDKTSFEAILEDLIKSTEKSLWKIEKVGKLRDIESRPYSLAFKTDILQYLRKSAEKIVIAIPDLQVNIKTEKKSIYAKCDSLVEELFTACFDAIASAKKDMGTDLVVEIFERESGSGFKELDFVFTSTDIELSTWRQLKVDILMMDPKLMKIADTTDIFTKQLITQLLRRYGGRVWIEEAIGSIDQPKGYFHVLIPFHE